MRNQTTEEGPRVEAGDEEGEEENKQKEQHVQQQRNLTTYQQREHALAALRIKWTSHLTPSQVIWRKHQT